MESETKMLPIVWYSLFAAPLMLFQWFSVFEERYIRSPKQKQFPSCNKSTVNNTAQHKWNGKIHPTTIVSAWVPQVIVEFFSSVRKSIFALEKIACEKKKKTWTNRCLQC